MYQIANEQIAPELRGMGRVVRMLMPSMKESTFHKANVLLKATKGKGAKGLGYRQVRIAREAPAAADDELRLCVYQPLEPQPNAPGFLWLHGGGWPTSRACRRPTPSSATSSRSTTRSSCTWRP